MKPRVIQITRNAPIMLGGDGKGISNHLQQKPIENPKMIPIINIPLLLSLGMWLANGPPAQVLSCALLGCDLVGNDVTNSH